MMEFSVDLVQLREAAEEIAARWPLVLEQISWNDGAKAAYDALFVLLRQEVARMLDRQPEKLMQLLYRIDVNEEKVKHAFERAFEIDLADELASLIMERQLQKMLLRRQHPALGPPADSSIEK